MKKVIIIFLVLAAYGLQGQSIGGGLISASGSGSGVTSVNGDTGPSVTLTANEINLNAAIDINNSGSNETQIEAALNALRIHGTYKDDIEAAANSVPLNGFYQVATGSTCCTAGTIRKRIN